MRLDDETAILSVEITTVDAEQFSVHPEQPISLHICQSTIVDSSSDNITTYGTKEKKISSL